MIFQSFHGVTVDHYLSYIRMYKEIEEYTCKATWIQWSAKCSAIALDLPLDCSPQVDEMLQRSSDPGFAASSF